MARGDFAAKQADASGTDDGEADALGRATSLQLGLLLSRPLREAKP
jgi:hypothetical protein